MSRDRWQQREVLGLSLPLLAFPLGRLILHLFTLRGYGWFRDEFYYLTCADHLAFGYVDQPPLSILVLWLSRSVLGDSLVAVRLIPALAGAATVLLTGLIARELGGGRLAQALAMSAALVAPIYLGVQHFYSMNALDLVVWPLAAWLLLRVLREPKLGRWAALGLVLGLGLQNKISVLWLGAGLLVGFLASRERRHLATRGPWLAGVLAALIFLPYVLWQIPNDWPTLEFMANATGQKMAFKAPFDFFTEQILVMGPLSFPLWIGGLGLLLFRKGENDGRILGWTWLAVFILLAASGTSRASYLAPANTWLLAAGGVLWEGVFRRLGERAGTIVGACATTLVLMAGVLLMPMAIPVLPVERYVEYAAQLGIAPSTDEKQELAKLPQFYADMHGWQSIVDRVADIVDALPVEDRRRVAIFTGNYGEAGAIDRLGRDRGLPRAISGHNNYWLWGPGGATGEVVVVFGGEREPLLKVYEDVELGGRTNCDYCMPYENDVPLWIARGRKPPFEDAWLRIKHYD